MNINTQWIIVTDLDGTLINHHDYSVDAAIPFISELKQKHIPVIFNTSKTFHESIELQNKLNIDAPFIVENGSCIYYPKSVYEFPPEGSIDKDTHWAQIIGREQSDIRSILNKLNIDKSNYKLLSNCSISEAVKLTGLTNDQAKLAIAREFSEPLVWLSSDSDFIHFKKQVEKSNLNMLQGGRFQHILGNCDKGIATQKLMKSYSSKNKSIKTIVLGDSANDAAMINIGDISIIVNSPSNTQLEKLTNANFKTNNQAPQGWVDGVQEALLKIDKI